MSINVANPTIFDSYFVPDIFLYTGIEGIIGVGTFSWDELRAADFTSGGAFIVSGSCGPSDWLLLDHKLQISSQEAATSTIS